MHDTRRSTAGTGRRSPCTCLSCRHRRQTSRCKSLTPWREPVGPPRSFLPPATMPLELCTRFDFGGLRRDIDHHPVIEIGARQAGRYGAALLCSRHPACVGHVRIDADQCETARVCAGASLHCKCGLWLSVRRMCSTGSGAPNANFSGNGLIMLEAGGSKLHDSLAAVGSFPNQMRRRSMFLSGCENLACWAGRPNAAGAECAGAAQLTPRPPAMNGTLRTMTATAPTAYANSDHPRPRRHTWKHCSMQPADD